MRRIVVTALAASLVAALALAALAQARPASVHEATIAITKTKVNNAKDVVVVSVKITQFFTGGHWQLLWKKRGTAQKAGKSVQVQTGNTGSTKKLAPGTWVLTVRLVDPSGTPYRPSRFPDATLSDTKTVTVR